MQIAALAFEAALSPTVGGAAGYWLDQRYGLTPWMMLVGIFFGVIGAAKIAGRLTKAQDENER